MNTKNSVYIATSIDGYIADREGGLGWLDIIPFPEGEDMGYYAFMSRIDAIVMGRKSFETVIGFGIDWPYEKPVFVMSRTLASVPQDLVEKVFIVSGTLQEVLDEIHSRGFMRLYIDGGKTIQGFLKADMIDEMIITTIPVLLGGGVPLFGALEDRLRFDFVEAGLHFDQIAQCRMLRWRE